MNSIANRSSKVIAAEKNYKFWEAIMQKYEKSGLRIKEFCRTNNLSFTKFRNWRFRIAQKQRSNLPNKSREKAFIPLVVNNESSIGDRVTPEHPIELRLEPSGNIHICVPSEFNSNSLSNLLAILRKVKC